MKPQTPEPIILAVALVLLALGAATLAYLYPTVEDITHVTTVQPVGDPAKPMKGDDIVSSMAIWNTPVLWKAPGNGSRLFQSAQYLFYPSAYPGGDYIRKMDDKTTSPSGVLLSWYSAHGLDFQKDGVDREDPDGDGFSNITEYKNEAVGERKKAIECDGTKSTDPTDPKSHPAYLARLRLHKY